MQININCKSIPTSFDVVCSNCEWTGVATLDYPENVKNPICRRRNKFHS
ncbi:hypothetical protein BANRA_05882 [Klebsiella pneumoniae]|nr:hypothetical protein BANRA_05882 [Klebsiella pneumoniae]